MTADLVFAEHPGKRYPAIVAFTAQVLDPASRTLQVELQVENSQHALFPGSYVEVHFNLAGSGPSLRLPANAIVFRAQGLFVAAVGAEHRVHLKHIVEGRDFGSTVEVLDGIGATEDIIVNPPDSITDGALVHAVLPPDVPLNRERAGL